MIPPLFHLTAKSLDIPPEFEKNRKLIQKFYPNSTINLHDDEAIDKFVKEYFPEYYHDTFIKMPQHIMRVDTVRYMWMYIYGGVYCDLDIQFKQPMEFQSGVIFIEREWTYPKDRTITNSVHNCIFASVPKHQIWMDILDGIAQNVKKLPNTKITKFFKKKQAKVFNVTGPNAISKIISQGKLLQKYNDVTVLPGKTLFQKGSSKHTGESSSVIHETAGSWN